MKNKLLIAIILVGAILFGFTAFFVSKNAATTSAVVPASYIAAGTKIESSMLKTIQIPANTPGEYFTSDKSLIGQKLKVSVDPDQLLYMSNIMSSWDDFGSESQIPENYVVTSIQLPANRAVGGLITPGDVVDVLGVPNNTYRTVSTDLLTEQLGALSLTKYGESNGINTYWVLSNVTILETDSSLTQSNESSISSVVGDVGGTNDGDFYIVALSYDDYQKLKLSEQYFDLHMSISPAQNSDNGPMLDSMGGSKVSGLVDSEEVGALWGTTPEVQKEEDKENE